MLNSHKWLVVTLPDSTDLEHSIIAQSYPGQRCPEEGRLKGLELEARLGARLKREFWARRPTAGPFPQGHRAQQLDVCSPGRKTGPVRQL